MEIVLYVARQMQGMKQSSQSNIHNRYEFFNIDKMFCVPDPKEAITFLEKTKEKVSPLAQTSQTLI